MGQQTLLCPLLIVNRSTSDTFYDVSAAVMRMQRCVGLLHCSLIGGHFSRTVNMLLLPESLAGFQTGCVNTRGGNQVSCSRTLTLDVVLCW